jgi:hypothetical protein
MSPYKTVALNHANLQRPIHVVIGTIAAFHYAPATQSTHVYTTGGVFPVIESPEQIDNLLFKLTTPTKGEDNVGTTATE